MLSIMSYANVCSAISASAFGGFVFIYAFFCLALSLTCVPQLYMEFPIFKLLFIIFPANVKEYAEKREARHFLLS